MRESQKLGGFESPLFSSPNYELDRGRPKDAGPVRRTVGPLPDYFGPGQKRLVIFAPHPRWPCPLVRWLDTATSGPGIPQKGSLPPCGLHTTRMAADAVIVYRFNSGNSGAQGVDQVGDAGVEEGEV
jgi:hypothetical protein